MGYVSLPEGNITSVADSQSLQTFDFGEVERVFTLFLFLLFFALLVFLLFCKPHAGSQGPIKISTEKKVELRIVLFVLGTPMFFCSQHS